MALAEAYPILEYDPAREALINPPRKVPAGTVPEHAVLCFFYDVVQELVAEKQPRCVLENRWEDGPHPLYVLDWAGRPLAFGNPGVGAPLAVGFLEMVIAQGCRKIIVCGGCGVLEPDLALGELVVLTAALRDEGTSYHYLPPAREVPAHPAGVAALERTLQRRDYAYRLGKTWTTDSFYRETRDLIARRRAEGCSVVEMEAAALMAVAQFREVVLGQVVYGGDDVSGPTWNHRAWQEVREVRRALFELSAEACLSL